MDEHCFETLTFIDCSFYKSPEDERYVFSLHQVENYEEAKTKYYNLPATFKGPKKINENIAVYLVASYLGCTTPTLLKASSFKLEFIVTGYKYRISARCKLKFTRMRSLFGIHIMPDVAVYTNDLPILLIEIISSGQVHATIRQLILKLIDCMRYIRIDKGKKISSMKGLVLPAIDGASFAVEVTVSWSPEQLSFYIECRFIPLDGVKNTIVEILKQNTQNLTNAVAPDLEFIDGCFYPLTSDEMLRLEANLRNKHPHFFSCQQSLQQLNSGPSWVFKFGNFIVKKFHTKNAEVLLREETLQLSRSLCVCKTLVFNKKQHLYVYEYLKPPLKRNEALKCFTELINGICEAVFELHNVLKCAHCDIRLENVCFKKINECYCPILIDHERLTGGENMFSIQGYEKSCMYRKGLKPYSQDYYQICCTALWILQPNRTDFHSIDSVPAVEQNKENTTVAAIYAYLENINDSTTQGEMKEKFVTNIVQQYSSERTLNDVCELVISQ